MADSVLRLPNSKRTRFHVRDKKREARPTLELWCIMDMIRPELLNHEPCLKRRNWCHVPKYAVYARAYLDAASQVEIDERFDMACAVSESTRIIS